MHLLLHYVIYLDCCIIAMAASAAAEAGYQVIGIE